MALPISLHKVKRIVLTRPAVEAGERLGFLPGDLADKVESLSLPTVRRPARHDAPAQGGIHA